MIRTPALFSIGALASLLTLSAIGEARADSDTIDWAGHTLQLSDTQRAVSYTGTLRIFAQVGDVFRSRIELQKTEIPCRVDASWTGTETARGLSIAVSDPTGKPFETWESAATDSSWNDLEGNANNTYTTSKTIRRKRVQKTYRFDWRPLMIDHEFQFGIQSIYPSEKAPVICAVDMNQYKH